MDLTGGAFSRTTSQTSRLRTVVINMNNSTAQTSGISNVYGIHSFGTGKMLV
ncbi:hypothetical protein OCE25_26425 [Bacillus cereus]|nr:hypothetical protein [Bacillus cereus]